MATAPNVVKFKRSSVAGKVPLTTDLNLGELALNTYDGVVYLKKSVSSVESVVALEPFPTGGTTGQILSLDVDGNLIWVTSSVTSSGTVTNTSVVNANGFTGTVATSTTTPAITLKTTVNGLLKGNSTTGVVSAATAGTDYLAPSALTGYATESFVTNQGYITSSALETYATESYVSTAISNATSPSVRYDINNQNLSKTEQSNARINIGLDDATIYFLSYMFG